MLRSLAAVALATSVVAVAAPASAQETERNTARPMGLRLELGFAEELNLARVGTSVDGVGERAGNNDVSIDRVSPNGDIKVGYDFGQFTPLIGLSFLTTSVDTGKNPDTSTSATVFVLDIEARYYFKPHRKGINPFVFGEFNTAFTSLGSDPEGSTAEKDRRDAVASQLDFTEINAGLGMEYKFDGASFAIGGKWGLGLVLNNFDEVGGTKDLSSMDIGTVGAIYAAWRP